MQCSSELLAPLTKMCRRVMHLTAKLNCSKFHMRNVFPPIIWMGCDIFCYISFFPPLTWIECLKSWGSSVITNSTSQNPPLQNISPDLSYDPWPRLLITHTCFKSSVDHFINTPQTAVHCKLPSLTSHDWRYILVLILIIYQVCFAPILDSLLITFAGFLFFFFCLIVLGMIFFKYKICDCLQDAGFEIINSRTINVLCLFRCR